MKNKRDKITYGIIGLGKFGMSLASSLAKNGEEIIALDKDVEKIRLAREFVKSAFAVQSLDKKTLTETGISECDIAVVCIGEQVDVSVLTTLNLVSIGVKRVIAKASGEEHGEILVKLGAEVVYPERDMAVRLAKRLENTGVIDFVQLSEKINVTKIMVSESLVGKTVVETDMRKKFGLNIIAVENGVDINESVKPYYVFEKGDILFVAGSKNGISEFMDSL